MKFFFLVIAILGCGYFAFDRYHRLEREKFLAAEKLRIEAEERRRKHEQEQARIALEKKQKQLKLAACTEKIRKKEQELKVLQQEQEQVSSKIKKLNTAVPADGRGYQSLINNISRLRRQQNIIAGKLRSLPQMDDMMKCYISCVRNHHIHFRVQMGKSDKKQTLGGTYSIPCRHWHFEQPHRHRKRYRRHRLCKYYDRNGYWFVHFICSAHNNTWTEKKADFYRRKCDDIRGSSVDRSELRDQYNANAGLLKQYDAELEKLKAKENSADDKLQDQLREQQKKLRNIQQKITAVNNDLSKLRSEQKALAD